MLRFLLLNTTLLLVGACLSLPLVAQDIADSVRNQGQHELTDGGYLELGVGLGYVRTPEKVYEEHEEPWVLDLSFAGEFRYKRLFLEAAQGSEDGLNIGFNLWNNESWLFDLLVASISGELIDDDAGPLARNTLYSGAGLRVTHYLNDYVLQYRLLNDIYQDNGLVSTLRAGRAWQYRNWLFHGIVSAQYSSEKTNNYWYGVDSQSNLSSLPEFYAPASTHLSLQLGADYPLSEKIVFRAYAGAKQFPDAIRESPLVDDYNQGYAFLTLNYVFF
ncbi:MipA/OmpV family protein [Agaribacterium sp. ZY112]|uniref:MipA/OmpV family protein n=1 Tax=Agaribacterium sp. ZY112 TaxID=3233574 RepID=UPI003523E11D